MRKFTRTLKHGPAIMNRLADEAAKSARSVDETVGTPRLWLDDYAILSAEMGMIHGQVRSSILGIWRTHNKPEHLDELNKTGSWPHFCL